MKVKLTKEYKYKSGAALKPGVEVEVTREFYEKLKEGGYLDKQKNFSQKNKNKG